MKYNDNGNYEDIVIKAVAPGRNSYGTSTSEVYSCAYTNDAIQDGVTEAKTYVDGLNTYSTDEKVVGTWIDNKPVYRKTYKTTTANATSWQSFNANIEGIDTLVSTKGTVKRGSASRYWHPAPCYEVGNNNVMFDFSLSYSTTATTVYYKQGSEFQNGTFVLTLEYTKITD